jgi:hypothetical protein
MTVVITVPDWGGGCPECGNLEQWLNVGRDHGCVCHYHMTKWCVGSNLFSSWRDEERNIWEANAWLLAGYTEVDPLPSTDRGLYADDKFFRQAMRDPRLRKSG